MKKIVIFIFVIVPIFSIADEFWGEFPLPSDLNLSDHSAALLYCFLGGYAAFRFARVFD